MSQIIFDRETELGNPVPELDEVLLKKSLPCGDLETALHGGAWEWTDSAAFAISHLLQLEFGRPDKIQALTLLEDLAELRGDMSLTEKFYPNLDTRLPLLFNVAWKTGRACAIERLTKEKSTLLNENAARPRRWEDLIPQTSIYELLHVKTENIPSTEFSHYQCTTLPPSVAMRLSSHLNMAFPVLKKNEVAKQRIEGAQSKEDRSRHRSGYNDLLLDMRCRHQELNDRILELERKRQDERDKRAREHQACYGKLASA